MNEITRALLKKVSDWKGDFKGAYNIRENGLCAGRKSSENIKIENRPDGPGLVIRISPAAQGRDGLHTGMRNQRKCKGSGLQ